VNDDDILQAINGLVDEEHQLQRTHAGRALEPEERERLRRLEEALDQCWDLLRQRRAKREFGENPDEASPRATSTVEDYLQ